MKTQFINLVVKVGPHVKTLTKFAGAGLLGIMEAVSEHKKAEQIEDLVKRVAELEQLVKQ